TAPKIVEFDLVLPAQQSQLVLVSPARKKFLPLALELLHFFHAGLAILMGDEFDLARELVVAADVIPVGVSVDDDGHGLVGDRLDLVEYRLAPLGEFGIDYDDSLICDESGGVSSAAADHVKVVFDLLDFGYILLSPSRNQSNGQRCRQHKPRKDS